jgi:hypothetical protein
MDSVVLSVVEKFRQRSEFGQKKYGTNLDRTDLSFLDWVNHMQEELMDAILYLQKMKQVNLENARQKCLSCDQTGIDKFEPDKVCRICQGEKYV